MWQTRALCYYCLVQPAPCQAVAGPGFPLSPTPHIVPWVLPPLTHAAIRSSSSTRVFSKYLACPWRTREARRKLRWRAMSDCIASCERLQTSRRNRSFVIRNNVKIKGSCVMFSLSCDTYTYDEQKDVLRRELEIVLVCNSSEGCVHQVHLVCALQWFH